MSETRETYAPLPSPRFRVEPEAGGGQQIIIPAQRQLFVLLFMSVWLCGWAFGEVTVALKLLQAFQPFLVLWICMWTLGGGMAMATVLWMATGRETLRTVGGNLEVSATVLGFTRRRLYRGADIRGLSASVYQRYRNGRYGWDIPFLWAQNSGAVKFSYGGRSVFAGVGLDETEGGKIVDLLRRRLPKAAD